MNFDNIFSIDLRSRDIRISYIRNGDPTSVQFQGSDTIRNAVFYGDEMWFGMDAITKSQQGSGKLILELKRLLGRSVDDSDVKRYMEQYPNVIDTSSGRISILVKELNEEVSKLPVSVLSDLMLYALGTALGVSGMKSIDIIAVSYPESFSELQKRALISVFTSLQIPQVEIVSDTVASCMYYFDIPIDRDCVMMVNFGSHNTSLSILSISASVYSVEITLGLDIGGEDLVENISCLLIEKLSLTDPSPSILGLIRKKSAEFMRMLQSSEVVSDTVEVDGVKKDISITREEFVHCCSSQLSLIHDKVQRLWEAATNKECVPRIVTVCGEFKTCSFLTAELKKIIGDVALRQGSDYAVTYGMLHYLANNSSVQERHKALIADGPLTSSLVTPIVQQSSKSPSSESNHVKTVIAEIPLICEDDDESPPDLPDSLLKKSPIPDQIIDVLSNEYPPETSDTAMSGSAETSDTLYGSIPLATPTKIKLDQHKSFTVSLKRCTHIGIKRQSFSRRNIRFLIFNTDSLPITVHVQNSLRFGANKEMYVELYEGTEPCAAECKLIRVFHMRHDDQHPMSEDVKIVYSVSVDRQGLVSVKFMWKDTGMAVIVDKDMYDDEVQTYLKEKKKKLEQLQVLTEKKKERELKSQPVVPQLSPVVDNPLPAPPLPVTGIPLPMPPPVFHDALPTPPIVTTPQPKSPVTSTPLPIPPPPPVIENSLPAPPLPMTEISLPIPPPPPVTDTLPMPPPPPLPLPMVNLPLPIPPTPPSPKHNSSSVLNTRPLRQATLSGNSNLVTIEDYREDLQRILYKFKNEQQRRIRMFLLRPQLSLAEYQAFHKEMMDMLEDEE